MIESAFFCVGNKLFTIFATNNHPFMNTFDFFIFIPILVGLIIGLFKGFVKELVSFLAIIAALVGAELFSTLFIPLLSSVFSFSEKTGKTVAYVLTFIVVLVIMFLLSKFIEKIISKIHLGWLNSLAGGALGALKYAVIVSIFMNVFDAVDSRFHFVKQEKKESSVGYVPILKIAPSLWGEAKKVYIEQKNDSISTKNSNSNNE